MISAAATAKTIGTMKSASRPANPSAIPLMSQWMASRASAGSVWKA